MASMSVNDFIKAAKAKTSTNVDLSDNVEWIGVEEYCKRVSISKSTVYRRLYNGQINGAIQDGNRWLIPMKISSKEDTERIVELTRENSELRTKLAAILSILSQE